MSNDNIGVAVVAQDTVLYVKHPASGEWYSVGGLTSLNGPDISVEEIEVTTLCSEAKEYIQGLPDYGTLSGEMYLIYVNPAQKLLLESLTKHRGQVFDFKVKYPDNGGGTPFFGFGRGFVNGMPISAEQNAPITTSLSIRLTGEWKFEEGDENSQMLKFSTLTLEESISNDGSVTGAISAMLQNDIFTGLDGSILAGVTFKNVPSGLTAEIIKMNNTTASIAFKGKAAVHVAGTSSPVTMVFDNAALSSGDVSNLINQEVLIDISWRD